MRSMRPPPRRNEFLHGQRARREVSALSDAPPAHEAPLLAPRGTRKRASGGLGGQKLGSMAGGDDDDSYSSRSSRSYSSRSGDSLYDEFEDFQ